MRKKGNTFLTVFWGGLALTVLVSLVNQIPAQGWMYDQTPLCSSGTATLSADNTYLVCR